MTARINFGYRLFNAPVVAGGWVPPAGAGLYAILIMDRLCHPQPFRPIYLGQAENYAERGFLKAHRKYWEWRAVADSDANLYVATYPMPRSTAATRAAAQAQLIEHYKPLCNERAEPVRPLRLAFA